jgi:hypothetical protein
VSVAFLVVLSRAIVLVMLAGIFVAFANTTRAQETAPAYPSPLTITSESLPAATLGQQYRVKLQATGGTPDYRWVISGGDLPDGVTLDPYSGELSGVVSKKDKYYFTVKVTDSSRLAQTFSKDFSLSVVMPLLLEWLRAPQVQGHVIDGAVKVSNATVDDFDLTVIVVGVNETGKAFVLGYQRFELKHDFVNVEIPFNSMVPQGAYVIHADAIAEVAPKNAIFRQQLETHSALPVTASP